MPSYTRDDAVLGAINFAVVAFGLSGLFLSLGESFSDGSVLQSLCRLGAAGSVFLGLGILVLPYPRRPFKVLLGGAACAFAGMAIPRVFQVEGLLFKLGFVFLAFLSLWLGYFILLARQRQSLHGE